MIRYLPSDFGKRGVEPKISVNPIFGEKFPNIFWLRSMQTRAGNVVSITKVPTYVPVPKFISI